MKNKIHRVQKISVLVIFVFVAIFGISLAWNIVKDLEHHSEHVRIVSRSAYLKDLQYRKWAATHGGVYVPVTEKTLPNPHLEHIPERDLQTPSGRKLTLENPAYMTRQVYEMGMDEYDIKERIISLKYLNPTNKPDEWEEKVLKKIETENLPEFSEVVEEDGKQFIRFLGAMKTEASCLKCHAKQGYKLGQVRGGISIKTSFEGLTTNYESGIIFFSCYSHCFFIGCFIGLFFCK